MLHLQALDEHMLIQKKNQRLLFNEKNSTNHMRYLLNIRYSLRLFLTKPMQTVIGRLAFTEGFEHSYVTYFGAHSK